MTENNPTNTLLQKNSDAIINGISTASFLQMLEQDRHTCTVQIQSGEKQGFLYFEDGDLIDAAQDHLKGTEAAYMIISWDNPSIVLGEYVTKTRQIEHPLGYILLNAAKHQDEDEQTQPMGRQAITYTSNEVKNDTDFQNTVSVLSEIAGIRYFYLLNRAGTIVIHSAPNSALGELIVYCIVTSSNLRKSLNAKSPRRIHMQMKDGTSLLITPKSGKILAMVLEAHSSVAEVTNQITTGLSVK